MKKKMLALTIVHLFLASLVEARSCYMSMRVMDMEDCFSSMRECMRRAVEEVNNTLEGVPTVAVGQKPPFSPDQVVVSEDDANVYVKVDAAEVDGEAIKVCRMKTQQYGMCVCVDMPCRDCCSMCMEVGCDYVAMVVRQEMKEESCKEDCRAVCSDYRTSRVVRSLPCKVCLENVRVEYCAESKELMLTLPKVDPVCVEEIAVVRR